MVEIDLTAEEKEEQLKKLEQSLIQRKLDLDVKEKEIKESQNKFANRFALVTLLTAIVTACFAAYTVNIYWTIGDAKFDAYCHSVEESIERNRAYAEAIKDSNEKLEKAIEALNNR